MTRSLRSLATPLMLVGLTALLAAQSATPKVNVKLGLWEMTSNMQLSGDMPGMDDKNLTDAQKAQMKAMMSSMMAKPMTNTSQNCLTKEKFEKGNFDNEDKDCKRTVISNDATTYAFKEVCTGDQPKTMTVTMTAPTPTTMSAKLEGTTTSGKATTKISGTITGKFLGADCGNVK